MKRQESLIKKKFAAPAIAGLALIGALLVPGTAQAAGMSTLSTDAQITVLTENGAPAAGATVEITGTWQDLLDSTEFDAAQAAAQAEQVRTDAWYDSQDRPAQRAYDQAYQAYLAGGSVDAWVATFPAQQLEMRKLESAYAQTDLGATLHSARVAAAGAKSAMFDRATETRTVVTDGQGVIKTDPIIAGGNGTRPTASVVGDDDVLVLPYAPSSTSTITID